MKPVQEVGQVGGERTWCMGRSESQLSVGWVEDTGIHLMEKSRCFRGFVLPVKIVD